MTWDNFVSTANKAKVRTKIQGNIYLNQYYPKKKQLLKMSPNF